MAERTGEKDEEVGTYTLWLYVQTGVFCLNCCSICEKGGCTAWIKWYWWKLTLILNEYLSCHWVCVRVMASIVCACDGQCCACVWGPECCVCVWGPVLCVRGPVLCVRVRASVVCACEGQYSVCVWGAECCACVWGPVCFYGCVCPRNVCINEINIIVILVWFLLCCIVKNT